MRPRKVVVVYSACEESAARLRFVLEQRLPIALPVEATGRAAIATLVRQATETGRFGCVVVLAATAEAVPPGVAALLAQVPSVLVVGSRDATTDSPAGRTVDESDMPAVLEAVRMACARKRGPSQVNALLREVRAVMAGRGAALAVRA